MYDEQFRHVLIKVWNTANQVCSKRFVPFIPDLVADWNDVIPGFFKVDLVAHCGDDANGTFLNSLVMVDISTGWLECIPLLRKSAADVINGVTVARSLMPFASTQEK